MKTETSAATSLAAPHASWASRFWTPTTRAIVAPVVVAAIFLTLWQAGIFNELLGLEQYAVPLPSDVLDAASEYRSKLTTATGQTVLAVLVGYAVGNGVGFVLALLLLILPDSVAQRTGTLFTAFQALPIIALAPLVALWVPESLWFKVLVVTVMVFPSMLVYAWRGMSGVDAEALELLASYNASPLQTLVRVRIPTAIPQIFTALKYTTVLALIGVVVCEILKSHDGLGYAIHDALQRFSTPEAWAAVAILGLLGITTYVLLVLLERVLFPWAADRR